MENLEFETPFARFVSAHLGLERFTLLDIGCSGGIHQAWRSFGDRLRAFAFDPDVREIARLRAQETLPDVHYLPAFVGIPPEDPAFPSLRRQVFWGRNPWDRLSVTRTQQLRAARATRVRPGQPTALGQTELADPEMPVLIPAFLEERGVSDVDFIKIDIDGPDFLVLRTLGSTVQDTKVLGIGVEVNFYGSADPEIHTFHNMDRLLKGWGFELFSLTTRPYSVAALPAPYQLDIPAQTYWGRPAQGDAVYLRDAAAPENAEWAQTAGPIKLLKLAALFSLLRLPDCAAEVLTRYSSQVGKLIDLPDGLDMLAAQSGLPDGKVRSFAEHIKAFEADAACFYPASINAAEQAVSLTSAEHHSDIESAEILRKNLRAAQERIIALQEEVASLRASTCWQLTYPLRVAANRLRPLLRRPK